MGHPLAAGTKAASTGPPEVGVPMLFLTKWPCICLPHLRLQFRQRKTRTHDQRMDWRLIFGLLDQDGTPAGNRKRRYRVIGSINVVRTVN